MKRKYVQGIFEFEKTSGISFKNLIRMYLVYLKFQSRNTYNRKISNNKIETLCIEIEGKRRKETKRNC